MDDCNLKYQDKLILRGLQFYGFHGVHPEEKEQGQKFLVDIDAWLDLRIAGETDDIINTVSYTDIYRIAKEIMEGPSQNLLESVAHLMANTTLLKYPQIHAVRVKVGKPDLLLHGPIDYLGVEILRSRFNNEK
ncbi:dihydroneopterin aldolase 2-like [Phalaenopsis equestris]|uniref:dihydroneopterin aldolase 2-like n=1 Tax=Phalaenopsis equestris TaxID=78828 RepID=UPI0009E4B435|nr:dihydroneopterin aldolase 2-like [Phalaenopsis equestris]